MFTTLAIIAVVFAVSWILVVRFPEQTRRWWRWALAGRRVIFGLFWMAFGFVLIGTGVPILILAGAIIWMAVALYVLLEDPQSEVKAWIGG